MLDHIASIVSQRRFPLGGTSLPFTLVIALHCAFQFLLNPVGTSSNAMPTWFGVGLMGALISEPVFFGIWAGLGPGTLATRLPTTFIVLIVLTFAGTVKRWNFWWQPGEPSSVEMDDLLRVSGFFALTLGMMLLSRKFRGWRIALPSDRVVGASLSQFSLKFLLGMTTLCAVLLTIGRWLSSTNANAAIVAGLALLILIPVLVLPFVVLSGWPSRPMTIFFPLLWVILTWLGIEAVVAMESQQRIEVASQLISFQAGAAIAALMTTIPLRLTGCRFVRSATDGD
jgi:hypothetical protein